MLTVLEVARKLEKDPETVRRWIRSGRLPAVKVGLQHMVDEADLPVAPDDLVAGPRSITTPGGTVVAVADVLAALRATRGRS